MENVRLFLNESQEVLLLLADVESRILFRYQNEIDETGKLVNIAVKSLVLKVEKEGCHILSAVDIVLIVVHEL